MMTFSGAPEWIVCIVPTKMFTNSNRKKSSCVLDERVRKRSISL
jgi:hypothetical protein